MGFRSTFTTLDVGVKWPDWFVQKYQPTISFGNRCLSSKLEAKAYHSWPDLPEDIQKAIDWDNYVFKWFVLVYLHECGGVTRVQIEQDRIRLTEAEGRNWEQVDEVSHHYCSGCNDAAASFSLSSVGGR